MMTVRAERREPVVEKTSNKWNAAIVVFVIAALVNVRKNHAVAGLLALMAAACAVLTVWFFIPLLHTA